MELEEMKLLWEEMSRKVEKQQVLTDKIIMEMTKQQYRNRFSKIISYEGVGSIICCVVAVFVLFNFRKLDTWYLQALGAFCVSYFFLMPFFIMRSLFRIRGLRIAEGNYRDNIARFARRKRDVIHLQRIALVFNFLLFLAIIPVSDKLLNDNDLFVKAYETGDALFIGATIVFATIVMLLISRWGYRSYKRVTASAENLLKDLEG